MSRPEYPARPRRIAAAAIMLVTAACSGTVEASYRPPPEPPPPAPAVAAPPIPPPAAPTTPVLTCGPDDVELTVGDGKETTSDRELPLVIRPRTDVACGVTNPVGVELLDADGKSLPVRIAAGRPARGRTAAETIPADVGISVTLGWRTVPGSPDADPGTDCLEGRSLRVTLTDGAVPIPVAAPVTACDGGSLVVGPAEVNAG